MSQADIGIASELTLLRESFQQELRSAEQDVKSWAQSLESVAINIPVRAKDEITSQIDQLRRELESKPINIPVNLVTSGGPGGGGSVAGTTYNITNVVNQHTA